MFMNVDLPAVGADNRPDLPGVGLEVNLIEGNDAGEAF
jgi:hypothetical protein